MGIRDSNDANDTATRILDIGERLVQVRGFNGFSYADMAAELDMTTAALHYHFPGKAELGPGADRALRRALRRGARRDRRPHRRRARQARRVRGPLRRRAARPAHVPVRDAGRRVPDAARPHARRGHRASSTPTRHGSSSVLDRGPRRRHLHLAGPASDAARLIVSGLEGAMLVGPPLRRCRALRHGRRRPAGRVHGVGGCEASQLRSSSARRRARRSG